MAALITTLVVYRSLAPLGLGLPRRSWVWAALCLALPLGYTLAIYPALQALGLVSLGDRNAQAGVLALTHPAASWLVGEQGALFAAVQLALGTWAWRGAVGGGSTGLLVARQ